jgi:hypothetical protein
MRPAEDHNEDEAESEYKDRGGEAVSLDYAKGPVSV